jgi:hypothetical protein
MQVRPATDSRLTSVCTDAGLANVRPTQLKPGTLGGRRMVAFGEFNPRVRRFATALLRDFPEFRGNLQVLPGGHFSSSIPAPRLSKARGLRCMSVGDGDVWIQLALRNAFYLVANVPEMRRVLRLFLSDSVGFVLTSRSREWTGTTLVHIDTPSALPALRVGESARVISWSGARDRLIRASASSSKSTTRSANARLVLAAGKRPDRRARPKRHVR